MDPQLLDALFREAVSAIEAGDLTALERVLAASPPLARERLTAPGPWLCGKFGGKLPGFFEQPYLLWFVAEDPVRNGRLPDNIAQLAQAIIGSAKSGDPVSFRTQLDHALRLVSWSTVARRCGAQIGLIDVLADSGASLDGNPDNALVNGNVAAAEHLVHRGAALTLATALCLERWGDIARLADAADARQRQFALVLAALNGKAKAMRRMIGIGADVNAPSQDLYPHGTPLHHAVCSGCLEAVQVLIEAGADPRSKDAAWQGTPLGWAEHSVGEKKREDDARRYAEIAAYLRDRTADTPSDRTAQSQG